MNDIRIRPAAPQDAPAISDFLRELAVRGKRKSPSDVDFVRIHYIGHPDRIACSVAVDAQGHILGMQSLKHARDGNIYGVTPGWGIIGTHVSPDAARRGVGRALFAASRDAARRAGVRSIDATIQPENAEGLAYYEAMGFRDYRVSGGAICKCYELPVDM